jgi:hypothetical protein
MAKLIKTVRRELAMKCPEGRYRGKAINIFLMQGDLIVFQVKGTRTKHTISIGHCYNMAINLTMEQEYKQKLREYDEKKRVGGKPRKPVKPDLHLNPKLYR